MVKSKLFTIINGLLREYHPSHPLHDRLRVLFSNRLTCGPKTLPIDSNASNFQKA